MIIGKDTNIVYISDILRKDSRYSESYKSLIKIFDECNIKYNFIRGAKDIWCRDYMPIQINDNDFVQFRYDPLYLKGYDNIKTNTVEVNILNNINPSYSNIIIDGGNIVNWCDKAIITDRVFDDNLGFKKKDIIDIIEQTLNCEVIIIPQIKNDLTGHSDGLVRFINGDTLVGTDRNLEYKYWTKKMKKILKKYKLNYIDVPTFHDSNKKYPHSAIGCYVNYLEINKYIILPIFEMNEKDDEAVDLFSQIFKDRIIKTVNINDIAVWGGLLNCITWNIKKEHI